MLPRTHDRTISAPRTAPALGTGGSVMEPSILVVNFWAVASLPTCCVVLSLGQAWPVLLLISHKRTVSKQFQNDVPVEGFNSGGPIVAFF